MQYSNYLILFNLDLCRLCMYENSDASNVIVNVFVVQKMQNSIIIYT